jgi:hypothetical protein
MRSGGRLGVGGSNPVVYLGSAHNSLVRKCRFGNESEIVKWKRIQKSEYPAYPLCPMRTYNLEFTFRGSAIGKDGNTTESAR